MKLGKRDRGVSLRGHRRTKICQSCGCEFTGLDTHKYCAVCCDAADTIRTQKYRARKEGLDSHFSPIEWVELQQRYENRCLRCGEISYELVPDHIVPLSKGGLNTIDNIQPLCLKCNTAKRDKTTDYRQ